MSSATGKVWGEVVMVKTSLTKDIEKALRYYKPKVLGGVNINPARGWSTAFEVPVECGTIEAGIIDCVRVCEYFDDIKRVLVCYYPARMRKSMIDCPNGITDKKHLPKFCDNTRCCFSRRKDVGSPKVLVICFEIKVTTQDFKSKNGHNFAGNLNYYVVPTEIYKEILNDVPDDVGIILYAHKALRRKKDATFKAMTEEAQKWMVLNVLKRRRRE